MIKKAIVEFFETQRAEIETAKKKEKIRVSINPDSYIGKEIMYQTALLKKIEEDTAAIRMMLEKNK